MVRYSFYNFQKVQISTKEERKNPSWCCIVYISSIFGAVVFLHKLCQFACFKKILQVIVITVSDHKNELSCEEPYSSFSATWIPSQYWYIIRNTATQGWLQADRKVSGLRHPKPLLHVTFISLFFDFHFTSLLMAIPEKAIGFLLAGDKCI